MQIIKLKETASTNDFLLELASKQPDWEGIAISEHQTSGKGMGANTWESESGKNLLFSILLHPRWLPINKYFLLSMAKAIAIRDVLAAYTSDITIKWPNDIYWKNKKISGTRIDTNINGNHISDMVIGTGININQRKFVSNAPNPVSLWQITGIDHNIEDIFHKIITLFDKNIAIIRSNQQSIIISRYHKLLYRRTGLHCYKDIGGKFYATIEEVMPNGILRLRRTDGIVNEYMFKEVEFIG